MLKRIMIVLVLTVVVFSFAAPKYVLKFNHVLSPREPYHEAFLKWAKAVEERTNGELKIEVYHSAQLGVEEDILEQMRLGANVGQNTDSARMGMYVKDIAVLNAPYVIDYLGATTPEQVIDVLRKLKQTPTMQKWLTELEEKYGFKVISFMWVQGYRHFITNKPITRPADLSGLRIRTPGAPIWQESVRALGAQPVAVNFGEIYSAVQTKAIDGAELTYANVMGGSLYEVLKYVSETGHILLINFEVVSAKWFKSLPKEYQQILVEEADKAGIEVSLKIMKEINAQMKEEVKKKGMIIVENVNKDVFRKAAEEAYKKLGLQTARNTLIREIKQVK
ncbi:C4-dicarboxylate TRAP transporter substrate-binding protein [Fervidobacterium gondwanense]|uniref:Tripartite ATP-independent transporter solute receptor, DctP family n=2 Tax=Fervidobacterium gondwanense TaxID=44754 RepID=A0A1M7RRX3_FERGO|nr:C4-dicarboxylate TRAP transporter substrate-binding protein [Fervidobacterium gondwanense]SHN49033.1 tripartite ATP-independent transporter solute receptor, DctP family [Fervidobacterium gondwanense DSM 13020]